MPAWLSDWRRLLLFYALSPSCSLSPVGKCRPLLGCMLCSASYRILLCRVRCRCELVLCVLSYRVYVFLCHTYRVYVFLCHTAYTCFSLIQGIHDSLSYRVYVLLCHTGCTCFCHNGYTCSFVIQGIRVSLSYRVYVLLCHTGYTCFSVIQGTCVSLSYVLLCHTGCTCFFVIQGIRVLRRCCQTFVVICNVCFHCFTSHTELRPFRRGRGEGDKCICFVNVCSRTSHHTDGKFETLASLSQYPLSCFFVLISGVQNCCLSSQPTKQRFLFCQCPSPVSVSVQLCVCVRARARAYVCVCIYMCVCARACMCFYVRVLHTVNYRVLHVVSYCLGWCLCVHDLLAVC